MTRNSDLVTAVEDSLRAPSVHNTPADAAETSWPPRGATCARFSCPAECYRSCDSS
jgi:hypothetical protein